MAKYIKRFETVTAQTQYVQSMNYIEPYISAVNDTDNMGDNVQYNQYNIREQYIEKTYIENHATGAAYINTGILATSNLGVEIKARVAYNGTNNGKESIFFGASKSVYFKDGNNFCIEKSGGNIICTVAKKQLNSDSIGQYSNYTNPFIIQYNYNGQGEAILYNQNRVEEFRISSTASGVPTDLNCYLFCRNINNSQDTSYSHPIRVYYCRMWQGTTLVRDFVPVLKISTQKYGLYDNVTHTFFGSNNSTDFFGG